MSIGPTQGPMSRKPIPASSVGDVPPAVKADAPAKADAKPKAGPAVATDTLTSAKEPPKESKVTADAAAPSADQMRPKGRGGNAGASIFGPIGSGPTNPYEYMANQAGIKKDMPTADLLAAAQKQLKGNPDSDVGRLALAWAYQKDPSSTLAFAQKNFKPADLDKALNFGMFNFDFKTGAADQLGGLREAWQKTPQYAGWKMGDIQKQNIPDEAKQMGIEKLLSGLKTPEDRAEAMKALHANGGPKAMADIARQLSARGLESGEFRQFIKDLGEKSPKGGTYLSEILKDKKASADFSDAVSNMLDMPIPGKDAREKSGKLDSAMRDMVAAAADDPKAKGELKRIFDTELSGDKRGPGDFDPKNKDSKLTQLGANRDVKFEKSEATSTKASQALEKASEAESTLKKMSQSVNEKNAKETFESALKVYGELELGAKVGAEASGGIPGVGDVKASMEASVKAKMGAGYDQKQATEMAVKEALTKMQESTSRAKDSLKSTVAREESYQKTLKLTGTYTTPEESQFEAVRSNLRDKLRDLDRL